MNFLGLPFLFALPLIAAPVIIHLYRGRQRDVVSWGAMQFLTSATTKGRNMQRLEELLLMLLRVATILALILALAQPMIRSSWFGDGANREVVLLLDNSLSMSRTVDEESACDRMIEQAQKLLEDLSSSDTVHVLAAAGGGQWQTAEGIAASGFGKQQLRALLQKIEPTLGTANLLKCLQMVVSMEPREHSTARRIVVFSDNQSQSWQPKAEGSWRQLGSMRENFSLPTSIEVVACEAAGVELSNLAVMEIEASRQLARPDERVDFSARVANVGEIDSEETTIEWLVDDVVFETTKLKSLAPREATRVTSQLRQEEVGHFAVTCRIQAEDQIALDRQSSVVIEVSDQLPILLVNGDEGATSLRSAEELFSAALGYRRGEPQSVHSVFRPHLVTADELADVVLTDYRAIVMLCLSDLPVGVNERLQAFVRSGGGLWVTLGEYADSEIFNRDWYDDGGGLSPVAMRSLLSITDSNKPEGSIHPPEQNHPATAQLANTTQLDIDEARLSEYWQFTQSGTTERQMWILLESGDGNPLAVENLFGDGRVLIQAFPLDLTWSNLPQLKSYVVMIHDWLDYLTAPIMSRYNLEPGSAILAHVPKDVDLPTVKLVTPAGQEVDLSTTGSDENNLVRYSQTQLPGLYRVRFEAGNEKNLLPFYVSRDTSESEWQPLAATDRAGLVEMAGLQFDGEESTGTMEAQNAESRPQQEPIWGALLLALVVLLIGEQLLSHWLARQRNGVAVSVT